MIHGDHPVEGLPTPSSDMEPGGVVGEQLEALRENNDPWEDAGIQTAYNFASVSNRANTGPLEAFTRMVKGRRYSPMVGYDEAKRGPVETEGDSEGEARQRVTVTRGARTVTYEFRLSTETEGRFEGCWVTDSVVVV